MNVKCPSCRTVIVVDDDKSQPFGVTLPCPSCGASVPVGDGGGSDLEFSLDVNVEFTDSGLNAIPAPAAPPARAMKATTQSLAEAEASDPFGIEISNSNRDAKSSFSFDNPGRGTEVSRLGDVDLNVAGTYHRTGRVLHHATDVVWTGRQKEAMESAGVEQVSVSDPRKAAAPRSSSRVDSRAPPVLADEAPAPRASAPPPRAPEPPRAPAPPPPTVGSVGGGTVPMVTEPPRPPPGAPGLEQLDFSSLLDSDSLSGGKGIFAAESNPFTDLGLSTESVPGRHLGTTGPISTEDYDNQGAAQPDNETSTFFIDAPTVGKAASAPSAATAQTNAFKLEISGPLSLDLGGDPGPATKSNTQTIRASTSAVRATTKADLPPSAITDAQAGRRSTTRRGTSKGAVAAAGFLLVVLGVGVAGEALNQGWFFTNAWLGDDESATPPPKSGGAAPGIATAPGAPAAEAQRQKPLVADTPAGYDKAIAELQLRIKDTESSGDTAAAGRLKDELLSLQHRYHYRWPGRFDRDASRKEVVAKLLPPGQAPSVEAQFWSQLAQTYETKEKRDDALRQAEVLLAQLPQGAVPPGRDLLYKAVLFKEQGKVDNALSLLDLALKERAEDGWALFEKAQILFKKEKLDDSDAALAALLRVSPEHREGRLLAAQLAVARKMTESYARARELAEQSHKESVDAGDAFGEYESNLVRANVYGLQNDLGKRMEALEGAAKFDPNDETLMLDLAENDLRAGDPGKAATRLKACKDEVCKSVAFFRLFIKSLVMSHQLQDAEAIVARAEGKYNDNVDLLFLSGTVLEARGKLPLAARKYDAVKQKDSMYLEAYLRLAGIHRREKEFDEAIKVLDEASKVFEGTGRDSEASMHLLQERGELLLKQGRHDQAREVFGKVVTAQPNNASARLKLAKLLVDLGYPQKALTHFEKLYEQGKSDADVTIVYAEALIRSGKPDRAIEELTSLLETNPNSLQGLVKLGNAYAQKQRYDDAKQVLERAVAINPNYAPAYFFAGLAELGQQRQRAEDIERRQRNGEVVRDEEKPDFTRAINALTTAKEKDQDNLEYREVLAQALTESRTDRNLLAALEQYDFIIGVYEKASRLGRSLKRNAEVYYRRGLIASKLGRPQSEVLKSFQDALAIDGERADFIARYAEELYRMQSRKVAGDKLVLEAKAYFNLVLQHHNANHVRANFYMGRILLLEWDRQRAKKPGDELHKQALQHFQRVVSNNGADEFPEAFKEIGNIMKDLGTPRVAKAQYRNYLDTYRRSMRRDPPDARYILDLIQQLE